ncbi:MAG: SAM-dependent DNA methyltransferase, partial [Alphaproteobacteria bacterium]
LEQLDSRTEEASKWIKKHDITKVLMNPPFENKYGCMIIVENVLNSVSPGTMCAFILPDKKLEKISKVQTKRILKNHRLRKVIKLPEDLFVVGMPTSVFIFESGVPQNDNEFFACYMKEDGLATVKNKGRHDVYDKWEKIKKYWMEVVSKQSGDESCQWINPTKNLSYQLPEKSSRFLTKIFVRPRWIIRCFKIILMLRASQIVY